MLAHEKHDDAGEIAPAYSTRVEEARRGRGEDRIEVIPLPDRSVFVVVDGAGGVSGGAAAAETVCKAVVDWCRQGKVADWPEWSEWLTHIDREISRSRSCGLAAAVVVEIRNDGKITGASVGDCEAWVFVNGTTPKNLTAEQIRKPLLGEGTAIPVGFEACVNGGTLLAATDGLWKYLDRARIAKATAIRPLATAADALVDGVRLRSGALQDDVAVAIVGWQ
jgi:PPM family protein phosphatase